MNPIVDLPLFMCMCCYSRAMLTYPTYYALPLSCFASPCLTLFTLPYPYPTLSCLTLPYSTYLALPLAMHVLPLPVCRNPSLGLATKAKVYKGVGQD